MADQEDFNPVDKKSIGFAGQKMIVIPEKVIELIKKVPHSSSLYLTHIGFFPKATRHYRKREKGINEHILIYCTEGNGWFELNGIKKNVGSDDVILLPSGVPHRYSADSGSPWTIYWVHFAGPQSQLFVDTFQQMNPGMLAHLPYHFDRISIFNEIFEVLEKGYSIENLNFANAALWHFLGTFCYADTYRSLKTESKEDPIDRVIQYMRENIDKELTLEKLSGKAKLSKSYFSELFKEKTAYSPIDYLIHLRIQQSCQFLDLTNLRVKEIAQKTGFRDHHYFTRIFTKTMGCPPTEYRKSSKG